MNYIMNLFNTKIIEIDKQIFNIEETTWKIEYINILLNDIKQIKQGMLTLSNILPLNKYIKIENLVALIEVYSKKNQKKIDFNYEKTYNEIKEILLYEKIKIIDEFSKIPKLRKLAQKYKTVLYDLKYNKSVTNNNYNFIIENLENIKTKEKVKILNELGYYTLNKTKNIEIETLINETDFNLEKIPRYENASKEKRKFIYSITPNIYSIIQKNNFENIEETLFEYFDIYNFNNNDKAALISLLLEKIYHEIIDHKEIFLSDEIYINNEMVNEILEHIKTLKKSYNKLKEMYKGFTTIIELGDKRELNFAYFVNQSTIARVFEDINNYVKANDIDNIQTRYAYNLLKDYIEKKPKVVFEGLLGHEGYFKIKYRDGKTGSGGGKLKKPRYILKKENGKLIILGFFLKQNQSGDRDYRSIINRTYTTNEELDKITTDNIFSLLENKKTL